jgi:hypothetical protein
MTLLKCISLIAFTLTISFYSEAQSKKKEKQVSTIATEKPKDSEKNKIKPYKEVITAKALSNNGLIDVHKVGEKWFFEIKDSLFEREIMTVTRYSKTAAGASVYGGESVKSQVVKWEKGVENKLFLRSITYVSSSEDSTKPIFVSVSNSNANPIIGVFDILARRKDTSYVIDVTDFFSGDNQSFSLSPLTKEQFKIKSFQKDKSFITKISTFPMNVEIKTEKTYDVVPPSRQASQSRGTYIPSGFQSGFVTVELNTSFVLLPEIPMRKRYFDPRVGFFANELTMYGEESQKVNKQTFAIRWRLEPKNDEDAEKQSKGELIEPKKPIVYYIDPATPEKWRKYLKAGIEDWIPAFEQAGWKNAIRGEYWPENNPDMSLEDARYSVIRYFASDIQNAYGPNVHDPRSGEIIESHIGWYHNIMRLLHNWYFIQASPNDPRARVRDFDDDLMGELIRFVSAHEVGHTLGLRHNMGASSATPVEKLRDKEWVAKNGHTSSIMDYARFNYVAQPEDEVSDLFPRVGDYDKWAIQWGYTYFFNTKSADEEKKLLHELTKEKVKNPRLRFGTEVSPSDPRYQTEDLGDNAMKASEYGIKNLQRIVPNLIEWTSKEGEDYSELEELYLALVGQFKRYLGHVAKNIGGIYDTPKTYDMEGDVYEVVPKNLQVSALEFMNTQLFQTPTWILNQSIMNKITPESGIEAIKSLQDFALSSLLAGDKLVRLMETTHLNSENFSLEELLTYLRNSVYSEIKSGKTIDIYRRNLQKILTNKLIDYLNPTTITVRSIPPGGSYSFNRREVDLKLTDLPSVVRTNLELIKIDLKSAISKTNDSLSKSHLQDLLQRIDFALNPK